MAEYVDRKALLELINEDCKYQNPTNEYTRGCNEVCDWAIKTIKNIPPADVVPKSEVEETVKKLMDATDKVICEAKSEVAREIFEEILRYLRLNEDIAIRGKEENGDKNEEYWKGKLAAFKQIRGFIDVEIKKKYTEK